MNDRGRNDNALPVLIAEQGRRNQVSKGFAGARPCFHHQVLAFIERLGDRAQHFNLLGAIFVRLKIARERAPKFQ